MDGAANYIRIAINSATTVKSPPGAGSRTMGTNLASVDIGVNTMRSCVQLSSAAAFSLEYCFTVKLPPVSGSEMSRCCTRTIFPCREPPGLALNTHHEPFGIFLFIDSPTTCAMNIPGATRTSSGLAHTSSSWSKTWLVNMPAASFRGTTGNAFRYGWTSDRRKTLNGMSFAAALPKLIGVTSSTRSTGAGPLRKKLRK